MAEIAVIVPVYNSAKFLDRCITSIKQQSFQNFEVIVIDDGSTDGSCELLKELVKDDDRFRLFVRQNCGVSVTRQFGLEQMDSKYVTFVDSDDWVPDEWLMDLYTEAEDKNCDIVWCDLTKVYNDHSELFSQKPTSDKIGDILADLMCGKIWGSCCNKLVRMSCIREYGVSFHPEMNMWEDLHFFWHLMKHNLKCSYIPKSLYNYDCYSSTNSIVRYRKASHIRSASIFVDSVSEQDYLPYCSPSDSAYARIKRGIYLRKCMIKRWAFHLNDKHLPVNKLFPEVNDQFVIESQQEPFWSENRCISLALKGHRTTGHFLCDLVDVLMRIKSSLLKGIR